MELWILSTYENKFVFDSKKELNEFIKAYNHYTLKQGLGLMLINEDYFVTKINLNITFNKWIKKVE